MNRLDRNGFENLIVVKEYFHSQVEKEQGTLYEFNKKIESTINLLQEQFSTQTCRTEEKKVLKEIYSNIKVLSKGSSNESLKELKRKVKVILEKGGFTETFSIAKKGSLEKLKQWLSSNIVSVISILSRTINREFYVGYKLKSRFLKNREAISELKKTLETYQKKYDSLKQQELAATHDSKPVDAIIQKRKSLKTEMKNTESKIEMLEKKNERFELLEKKGIKTRENFAAIGGQRVTIKTEDHVKLDGFFLSANKFREKLVETGAEVFTIDQKDFPPISGLIFDANDIEENEGKIFQALDELKLFSSLEAKGSGYIKVSVVNENKVLIIDEKEKDRLIEQGKLAYSFQSEEYKLYDLQKDTLRTKPLSSTPSTEEGTIILGGGASGVYEGKMREILTFLTRGLNVMVFNYRGYSQSQGEPTPEGTHLDVEAVYQYLKQEQHIEDEQMIGKGLCLSGGIMANLASRHPKMHLFLDQTYAEMSSVIQRGANRVLKEFLKGTEGPVETAIDQMKRGIKEKSEEESFLFHFLKSLIAPAIQLLSPSYSTLEGLSKVEGRVLILESNNDEVTHRAQLEEMVTQLAKHDKLKNTQVGTIPGIHGENWYDVKSKEVTTQYTGRSQVDHFLESIQLLNPIIPREEKV